MSNPRTVAISSLIQTIKLASQYLDSHKMGDGYTVIDVGISSLIILGVEPKEIEQGIIDAKLEG